MRHPKCLRRSFAYTLLYFNLLSSLLLSTFIFFPPPPLPSCPPSSLTSLHPPPQPQFPSSPSFLFIFILFVPLFLLAFAATSLFTCFNSYAIRPPSPAYAHHPMRSIHSGIAIVRPHVSSSPPTDQHSMDRKGLNVASLLLPN